MWLHSTESYIVKKKIVSTIICTLALPTLLITEVNYTEGKVEQKMCVLFIKSQGVQI